MRVAVRGGAQVLEIARATAAARGDVRAFRDAIEVRAWLARARLSSEQIARLRHLVSSALDATGATRLARLTDGDVLGVAADLVVRGRLTVRVRAPENTGGVAVDEVETEPPAEPTPVERRFMSAGLDAGFECAAVASESASRWDLSAIEASVEVEWDQTALDAGAAVEWPADPAPDNESTDTTGAVAP